MNRGPVQVAATAAAWGPISRRIALRCAVAFVPARQMGLAVLANSFGPGADPTGLAVDVLRTLLG